MARGLKLLTLAVGLMLLLPAQAFAASPLPAPSAMSTEATMKSMMTNGTKSRTPISKAMVSWLMV